MANRLDVYEALRSLFGILVEVVFFWQVRLYAWWSCKPRKQALIGTLRDAKVFEEWEAAAFLLDELSGHDLWRQNPTSKHYDYRLIFQRLHAIIEAREDVDILGLVNLLRSGLVRNLGNITANDLYNRATAGTKLLIEDYITQVALAIGYVGVSPTSNLTERGLSSQAKLDLLHDTRQAFGRSALILQGGAIFGLCHIGVVKALHLRGLLPRIIAGTDTGALIAALVGVHTEGELLDFLTGDRIDLSAFGAQKAQDDPTTGSKSGGASLGWFATLGRRLKRFLKDGYLLDVHVLEECVRANVGNMTFEEAYARTKRVLNITVQSRHSGGDDVPSLLNYLTAPNVLIWSAATASNAGSTPLYSPVTLLSKTATGDIVPWSSRPSSPQQSRRSSSFHAIDASTRRNSNLSMTSTRPHHHHTPTHSTTPLTRIAELFNVNHFIVSQARPSIAPFLQSSTLSTSLGASSSSSPSSSSSRTILPSYLSPKSLYNLLKRLLALEIQHRLRQASTLNLIPASLSRYLIDDFVPGASLTLVPELHASDFIGLLERPTKRSVDGWILRGERSVWPAVGALKVRCAVEFELDRAYQLVRRRKPMDAFAAGGGRGAAVHDDPDNREERERLEGLVDAGAGAGAQQGLGDATTPPSVAELKKRKQDAGHTPGPQPELGSQGEIWGQGQLRGNGEKRRQKRAGSFGERL